MALTKREQQDLAAAISDFDTLLELCQTTRADLDALREPEKPIPLHWDHYDRRLTAALARVAEVRATITNLGDVYAAAGPFLGQFGGLLPHMALTVIKGGTAALSAINYDTRMYIKRMDGSAVPSAPASALEWGALGLFSKMVQ